MTNLNAGSWKESDLPDCPDAPPSDLVYDPHDDKLCAQFASRIRSLEDEDGLKLRCTKVYAVHKEDRRGLVEVNYVYRDTVDVEGSSTKKFVPVPQTAWLRGTELAWTEEGW